MTYHLLLAGKNESSPCLMAIIRENTGSAAIFYTPLSQF